MKPTIRTTAILGLLVAIAAVPGASGGLGPDARSGAYRGERARKAGSLL